MRNATYNAFSLSFYRSDSLFLYYQSIRTFFQKKINSVQVERTWDFVRDSGQRKLTYSSQNHCTSSRSVYLSRRLNSHWERFVITHHLQKWESQLRLRWICFWATPVSKNFALYQFGSTKNAVSTKLSIQHFLFIWYIPSKLHTGEILASFIQSRVLGQALKRLVTVSSMCCHTSTSALSTSYSSRVFTPL